MICFGRLQPDVYECVSDPRNQDLPTFAWRKPPPAPPVVMLAIAGPAATQVSADLVTPITAKKMPVPKPTPVPLPCSEPQVRPINVPVPRPVPPPIHVPVAKGVVTKTSV